MSACRTASSAILDATGEIVARARRSGLHAAAQGELAEQNGPIDLAPQGATLPAQVRSAAADMIFDADGRSVSVWRPLPPATTTAGPGTIVANLDVASFLTERQRLRLSLLLFDLALSSACAGIGFYLARQMQRPVTLLTQHLVLAEGEVPQPVAPELIPDMTRRWRISSLPST